MRSPPSPRRTSSPGVEKPQKQLCIQPPTPPPTQLFTQPLTHPITQPPTHLPTHPFIPLPIQPSRILTANDLVPKIPREIRLMIAEDYFEFSPRTVTLVMITTNYRNLWETSIKTRWYPPHMYSVLWDLNYTLRGTKLLSPPLPGVADVDCPKPYKLIHNSGKPVAYFPPQCKIFDFERDTLHLKSDSVFRMTSAGIFLPELIEFEGMFKEFRRVKKLAISWEAPSEVTVIECVDKLRRHFPNFQQLILVRRQYLRDSFEEEWGYPPDYEFIHPNLYDTACTGNLLQGGVAPPGPFVSLKYFQPTSLSMELTIALKAIHQVAVDVMDAVPKSLMDELMRYRGALHPAFVQLARNRELRKKQASGQAGGQAGG